ncbi:MAG: Gfo/Idh/MocA family oxidoreductase [Rhodoferax sp.]|uniref:Gfo/Idh/MocA family protein n=1 Tax=Rhodoferax sp. TaxID=50421 RepID=UPI00326350E5
MAKLNIAVAGAGIIGLAHIDVLAKSSRCALSAIVDPSPAAVATAAKAGVPLYTSLAALFTSGRPDGVVLATPNHLHLPQALECMAAGVPILLEKPIAATLAEGLQLQKVVEDSGARVLIGHHRAHSPIMAKAKEVVDSGKLGKLVSLMGSAQFFKPDDYFASGPWRTQPGGGPILINLIHEVHNLRMLCGDITAVQAFASNATRGFAVEDTVAINLRFASGVLGSFMLSDTAASARSWEQTSQENKAYTSYADEDCYLVAGTLGSLAVPTMRLKTYPRPEDRSWWKEFEVGVVGMVRDDPLKHQMNHFADVITGKAAPLVSARDGVQNLRVTEAIAEAAKTGLVVTI